MGGSLFIGGHWVDTADHVEVTNPADGQVVGEVSRAGAAETAAAVDAAWRAWPDWRRTPADRRADLLRRVTELMYDHQEELAHLLTSEQGKPLSDARGEIIGSAELFRWYAEEGRRVHGEVLPAPGPDRRFWVWPEPIGVVGVITPWNYPCLTVARKVAAALAAGCTVVIKPALLTPLSAVALARLAEEAGLPAGTVNLVTGPSSEIGPVLMSRPEVRKITFTGSTEVGRQLMREAAATIKSLSLELGGHAPLVVFADADLDRAVAGAVTARFRSSGQICHSANRIYVERSVLGEFSQRFAAAVAALKVAPGNQPGAQIGPLIDAAAVDRADRHVRDAVALGARVLTGGRRPTEEPLDRGTFYLPTVLADCDHRMVVTREETFGPVAPVIAFDTEEEAVALANDTSYGLAAYLFTRDLGRAVRVAEALEAGIIGLNDARASWTYTPFGGIKESGFGREGGHWGIEEFLTVKSVAVTL